MPTEQAPDRTTESFQGLLLRHRGRTGLTQRQLATRVGVSRRSIQDWEARLNYPDAQHLQALIVAFLEAGGLTVGSEITEAEALWAAALRQAPRMQTPFDPSWWTRLLARRAESTVGESAPDQDFVVTAAAPARASEQRHDWGEAPDIVGFVGRAGELARLRRWIVEERSRLVAVLGIGGIGKSILAAQLAQDVSASFQRVYWRSLRDALPTTQWLAGAIGFLSGQQVVPPDGEAARLSVLLELLRDRRGLLVLDNFETVLEPGQREGRYRDGLAGYGALVQAVGETSHQSCLVVTSREAPLELAALGGQPVRRLELGGLGVSEGQFVLAHKQLSGDTEDWINLISRFGGNGLALKVVGESIREVFGGDIGGFLEESGRGTVFGGIRRLLAEQIERSSGLEQNVLRVLAVEREPVTLGELIDALGPRVGRGAVLEAVEALRRRSLLERAGPAGTAAVQSLAGFTLQSVVLEYVTDRLVEDVSNEIARGRPLQLVDQPLIKAQAKDYVRDTQERLIGEPILQQLQAEGGYSGAEAADAARRVAGLLEGQPGVWAG
jgi:transcriptional regulator with XRE-family HTH domain